MYITLQCNIKLNIIHSRHIRRFTLSAAVGHSCKDWRRYKSAGWSGWRHANISNRAVGQSRLLLWSAQSLRARSEVWSAPTPLPQNHLTSHSSPWTVLPPGSAACGLSHGSHPGRTPQRANADATTDWADWQQMSLGLSPHCPSSYWPRGYLPVSGNL